MLAPRCRLGPGRCWRKFASRSVPFRRRCIDSRRHQAHQEFRLIAGECSAMPQERRSERQHRARYAKCRDSARYRDAVRQRKKGKAEHGHYPECCEGKREGMKTHETYDFGAALHVMKAAKEPRTPRISKPTG